MEALVENLELLRLGMLQEAQPILSPHVQLCSQLILITQTQVQCRQLSAPNPLRVVAVKGPELAMLSG